MAGPIDPRLLKRAEATRSYLVASVAVGIVSSALIIAQAYLLALGISTVFDKQNLPSNWQMLLGVLAGVFVMRALLGWANSVLAHRCAARVKSQLRRDVMAARLARPCSGVPSSTVVHVVTTGIDALDGYFSKYLPQLGLAMTVPLIVGLVVLITDWRSAFIIAFTLPLIPLFMALIGWSTQKATARSFSVADRLTAHFADLIEGLPTLQAFARAKAQRRGIELGEQKYRATTMQVLLVSFLSAMALELLASLSVAIVAVTVGFRLVASDMSFFTALFVLILAPEAYLPVRQVGIHFHDSADGVAAADAAFNIIDEGVDNEPEPPAKTGAQTQRTQAGSHYLERMETTASPAPAPPKSHPASLQRVTPEPALSWEEASYTYPGATIPALAPLKLCVNPGEVVALTGRSGSGKSTALALAMGFISPTSGRILIGGQDLADLDLRRWRRQVAWVSQDPGMLHGSVADNVRLASPEATAADIEQALAAVGADFPADKPVGDDGQGLSGGQRRRVAMARAWLRIHSAGARWLILDEPTAGLDLAREAEVIASVRALGVGALIVTHRSAVIATADRVVELSPPHRNSSERAETGTGEVTK